ncbi:MAG: C4-type zinc ribbon domain-containing protein [Desulfobacterales bacterium]|jgi:predicted  nucleic acid-binding Zn-ribbon protein|nr:C4-type zinc ribbon domain-containing protein [Desulfobacterales bacterium]
MSNVTKEQIVALVNLQQIEIETGSVKTKISNVDQRLEKLDDRLHDFKQVIEKQESVINELNQKYRDYETDVRMNLDAIKKSEAKLSSVKTNKEYQAFLKEIDDIKEKNSKLEDDMIDFLDRIEAAENTLNTKMAEYSELQTRLNNEKETIQKETEEGKRQLEDLDAQLKTVAAGIDAALLATYNKVKALQNNAIGIVAVTDAVCQGCNMNIPPQMYNELQRGDSLKKCPICDRIIYWKNENKRSE